MDSSGLYKRAHDLHVEGKEEQALEAYEMLLDKFPDSAEAVQARKQMMRINLGQNSRGNQVASAIYVVGIIQIVLSIFIGLFLVSLGVWPTAVIWWIAGGVSGLMLIGFSEIIRLLHEINLKT